MKIITTGSNILIHSVDSVIKTLTCTKTYIIALTVSTSKYAFDSLYPVNVVTKRRNIRIIPELLINKLGEWNFSMTCPELSPEKHQKYLNIIQEVGENLKKVCDRPDFEWKFALKEDNSLNAACFPGGKTFITVGLMRRLEPKTDSEFQNYLQDYSLYLKNEIFKENVAAVLGHEMAHACASHGASKLQFQIFLTFIKNVAEVAIYSFIKTDRQIESPPRDNRENKNNEEKKRRLINSIKIVFKTASALLTSRHSRHCETEADVVGMKYAALARYGTDGMIRVQKVLKDAQTGYSIPWLNSHPTSDERIQNCTRIKERIDSYGAKTLEVGSIESLLMPLDTQLTYHYDT